MITKDFLIIGGIDKMSIINVNKYIIIKIIDIPNSGNNMGFCMLNKNMFLTGDSYGTIRQWKIENDNINIIFKKDKAHSDINNNKKFFIVKIGNGKIASCFDEKSIIIW